MRICVLRLNLLIYLISVVRIYLQLGHTYGVNKNDEIYEILVLQILFLGYDNLLLMSKSDRIWTNLLPYQVCKHC